MSEYVQSLELRIKDNAGEAASGLGKLADTLSRIKRSIGQGLGQGLEKTATQLTTFNQQISKVTNDNSLTKLERLASTLERICNATKGMSSVRGLTSAVRQTTGGAAGKNDPFGFGTAETHVRDLRSNVVDFRKEFEGAANAASKVSKLTASVSHATEHVGPRSGRRGGWNEFLNKNSVDLLQDFKGYMSETAEEASKIHRMTERTTRSLERIRSPKGSHAGSSYNWLDNTPPAEARNVEMWGKHGRPAPGYGVGAVPFSYGGMASKAPKIMELGDALEKVDQLVSSQTELDRVRSKIDRLRESLAKDIQGGISEEEIEKRVAAIQKLIAQMEKLESKRAPLNDGGAARAAQEQAKAQEEALNNARGFATELVNGKSSAELMKMQIDGMTEKLAQGIASGKLSQDQIARGAMQIQTATEKLRELNGEGQKTESWLTRVEKAATEKLSKVAKHFKNIRNAIFDANGGLLGMLSGMIRVAKYRMFRSLIREITEGFSTGLENVRKYSQAINGLYYRDMKGLDNSLLKMKNSLGAAVAPAIQALIPLFQTLTHWVIEASNYINQFFALLNGASTWTRAVDVDAEQFEELKKSSAGAAKEMKNLLASWDELNIIQSQSGGGGGGNAKQDMNDYSKMFEEVDTFDTKVRGLVEFLKDNMPIVEGLLVGLGAKLLGLKFPAAITITGIVWSFEQGKQDGEAGKSFLESLESSVPQLLTTALGGAMVGFELMPPGEKLHGALCGFAVGAALSLYASLIGWAQGENVANVDTWSFTDTLQHDIWNILIAAAAGGTIGWMIGGVKGAIIGATIGASVEIFSQAIQYKAEGDPNIVSSDFGTFLKGNAVALIGASAAGVALGAHLGGVKGAAIGFLIGASISLFASVVQWQKNNEALKEDERRKAQEEFDAKVEELRTEMQNEMSKKYFGIDVEVTYNVVNQHVQDLENSRAKAIKEFQLLNGTWQLVLRGGVEKLTDERKNEILGQVNQYVETVNGYIKDKAEVITLSASLFGDESGEFSTLEQGIENQSETIKNIGKAIGDYLSKGTIEGYSGTLQDLTKMLNEMTNIILETQISGDFSTSVISAGSKVDPYNTASVAAYMKAYAEETAKLRATAEGLTSKERIEAETQIKYYTALLAKNDEEFAIAAPSGMTRSMVEQKLADVQAIFDSLSTPELFDAAVSERYARLAENGYEIYALQLARIAKEHGFDERIFLDDVDFANANPWAGTWEDYSKAISTGYGLYAAELFGGKFVNTEELSTGIGMAVIEIDGTYYGIPETSATFNGLDGTSTDGLLNLGSDIEAIQTLIRFYEEVERKWPGQGGTDSGRTPRGTLVAGAGFMTDVPYVNASQVVVTGTTVETDDGDRDDDAEMQEQNRLLREILSATNAIRNKEFKVNPSATWGIFNRRSEQMANALIG